MNNRYLIPVFSFSLLFAASAGADPVADFSMADKNQDGVLGMEEAREALPETQITDVNGDGIVSKAEAENSIPGLTLTSESAADAESPVGSAEYLLIVQAITEETAREVSAAN